tara:strand:- start:6046 stop:7947 length:1902 start_codon:yes stop_codon:yes gene_type:complete
MAEDPKKLAEAQRIANKAMEEGVGIQRNFGELLNQNIKTSGKLNSIIKNRLETMKAIDGSLKDQSKSILDSTKLESQLQSISKKLADSRNKSGQFQKGYNNLTIAALKTDKEGLKAGIERVKAMKELNDVTGGLVEKAENFVKAISVGAIFASLVAAAKKFGATLDTIGQQFGSLDVLGKPVTDNLLNSQIEAIKLGGSIQDVASITNTLASNFGMSLEEASKLSGKVFDTSKALGLSADESANLFGALTQVANLSAEQAESLAEGAFQLARQRGVAPSAVLRDISGSAEEIALFTKGGGDNIAEAAVQARSLGMSLSQTAKIAEGLLDFESSITKEVEASVLIGRQINLQKAREAALSGDIAGAMEEVVKQVGSEQDFLNLNLIQRKALADSIGVSVNEMAKLVGQSDKLSLSGAMAAGSFEDLLGEEGISTISQLTNTIKSLGASLVNSLGPALMAVTSVLLPFVNMAGSLVKTLSEMGAILPIVAAGLAYMATQSAIGTAKSIRNAYAKMAENSFKLPFPASLAAGIAGAAAIAAIVAQSRNVDDFTSSPGGITTMMGPAGVFSLNPRDSVLATTNPIPVNDLRSFPASTQQVATNGGGEYVLRAEGNDLVARIALGANFGGGSPSEGMA